MNMQLHSRLHSRLRHSGRRAFGGPNTIVCAAATAPPPAVAFKATKNPSFPFTKIADQAEMKLALLLNVVDPNIGGVLVMGDRGTGKSVAVRAVVDLLPEIQVVPDDPFNSHPTDTKLMGPYALTRYRNGEDLPSKTIRTPLVELPLGATEDRICGTIDIEKALSEGVKAFEPGLLAKANRGILYVDEVNLLDDGLVDVVLDAAASGINTVEREGVSIVHPARFIMIGSGNPTEGELRPQLLDRFGLSVSVSTIQDKAARTQLVLDRMAYDSDPDALVESARPAQEALMKQLSEARARLPRVKISDELQLLISELCSKLEVDGLRGDLVTNRAAKALVAFEGRDRVTQADIERVVAFCLNHRMRKDPLDPIDNGMKVRLLFKRMTDPEVVRREEEAKRKREEAEKKAKESGQANRGAMKAGAWGGLPGR
ncbi:magnesium chelatase subunit I [Haematococcus lacustris]